MIDFIHTAIAHKPLILNELLAAALRYRPPYIPKQRSLFVIFYN
ncbi:hypothetical protein [Dolichospermum compactum]|nr:hypothetical protein [Dolichospermum compactum]